MPGYGYPPPYYGPTPYGMPPTMGYPPKTSGFAIAALVIGIIGILFSFSWYIFFIGIPLDALAIIFGGIGLAHAKKGYKGRGMAIAGLVLGIIGISILGTLLMLLGLMFSTFF